MEFRVSSRLSYNVSGPASFLINVAVVESTFQRVISESFYPTGVATCVPIAMNGARYYRVTAKGGPVTFSYEAVVDATYEQFNDQNSLFIPLFEQVPEEAVVYLYPSRFCESDLLYRLAKGEFSETESGFNRVTRICNWIFEHVEYLRGTTTSTTSAFDTVTERAGVCRDFAHLAIAFCRTLGIPARFVSSYAYGLNPPDFHAHLEAFIGGRWILFDPTRLAPQTSFVRIGQGRDAADTSFATIYGNAQMTNMEISMQPNDPSAPLPQYVITPISNCRV